MNRGLKIDNRTLAISRLSSISYYRLSAYWYPFRERDPNEEVTDTFVPDTNLNECFRLYEFDRKLRLLILDAIERVEVAIRTHITYSLAHAYGAFGHTDPLNFHPNFKHQEWLDEVKKEVTRSREEFIVHYEKKYLDFPILPLWILTEVMSLGNLSKLYKGMKNTDKQAVAQRFNIHYKRLADWLHTLTYVRNICAHHSRLWNRELGIRPEQTKEKEWLPPITPRSNRIFYVLLILKYLLQIIHNAEDWLKEINNLLEPFTDHVTYRAAMGIPKNWKKHPLWKK